jgi:diguanylate cyclase (GGDEF)-like protein
MGVLALLIMRLMHRLRNLSQRDPLTGLLNRRAFDEKLQQAWLRHRRQPLVVLAVDIDHFKRINDLHGHASGDAVLVGVAQQLQRGVTSADVVARVGGEEFLVLFKRADLSKAQHVAEQLRLAVAGHSVPINGTVDAVSVTISIGVAATLSHDADPSSLKQRADEALYRAKAVGRNCVQVQQMS